ncbi:hypothetical protein LAZ67_9002769 [Cordylochernes scorpioides]|uniref:Uncharacterized protein n=1 Tax=Cordylochernes scorpioides TaxID=51811 RepID=A0ABY6KU12_9ARAC|nr:hypothetical protein LAZ67_9002769 [Cordylochernes scorpioides]
MNMAPLPALQSLVENRQWVSSDTTYFAIYEEYVCQAIGEAIFLSVPIALGFSMLQGQTLQVVGVHLESPCFSHGQLYVACSRVSSPKNLFVFSSTFSKIRNIVYQGALIYRF